ncbi:hypothetical protein HC028_26410 [Planosporangium flavigriseum]|uniref:WXG100 family type VII secretion target n=1 Tax=Planosporangium flavigriseum TaxID=373681 RepID=A0A8J3M476_9ACTN|nr:hypothetical protein [Planosporangium flavigriseum]NJC68012.1 hypothetical protein [Planosporangium flavigriseum]GIG76635.1 hypothetical protein Pfl04_50390 [Planosporangium flavigriseum]
MPGKAALPGTEVRLDAPRAERAGANLAHAGTELARLRQGIGAELEAAGAARPWGSDSLGAAFQSNYDTYAPRLLAAWASLASQVESLGSRAIVSVHNAVETDAASSRRMTEI